MARRVEPEVRDLVLYTDGLLADPRSAKTAHGVLRFAPGRVVAILDGHWAGRSLATALPWCDATVVPVVATLDELRKPGCSIVVGFAPGGGRFAAHQRALLLEAVDAGYRVINGLHEQLPAGPRVVNLRAPDPMDCQLARGAAASGTRILTVGTSGGIGKMTTTIELCRALGERGLDADWLATGQTGVILRGIGRVIDSIVIDYVPGTIERILGELRSEIVVIEGQGSLFHPAFSPSMLALMHATRPQYHVVCHRLGQTHHRDTEVALPTIEEAVRGYGAVFEALGIESLLLGISLDSSASSDEGYEQARATLVDRLGVPCCDPVRDSVAPLVEGFVRRGAACDEMAGGTATR